MLPGTHMANLQRGGFVVLRCSTQSVCLGCGPLLAIAGCREYSFGAVGELGTFRARIPLAGNARISVDIGRSPAGGRRAQPKLCHEPAFPCRGQAPRSALSDILKPLVKGRSISHVSLACGIKSNERTLLIYHQRWGRAFLNNCLCAVTASLGDKQHQLGIHEAVAWCPRATSQRCQFPATEPVQGQKIPRAALLLLPSGCETSEIFLVA